MRTKYIALVIAMIVVTGSGVALVSHATQDAASTGATDPPVAVYADLDGTWAGTFVGYDTKGKELYRIAVRQTYQTINDTTQTVTIEDRMTDGTVITGEGRNIATRRDDGTLELTCIVNKSNGDRVEHAGRIVTGPDDDKQFVWYSNKPGRVETFRESVRRENGETIYEINGMGRYGETMILMTGRYRKIEPLNTRQ